ncbi:SigE family RNA polymerase sigma factor [Streptomyces sp. ISL-43]|uniref:SigE family RNA polymerase sigma factor n=1 Tax=Streptomyces sp. ISL-43 TaxID=2819183 RepID=UPI001BE97134|nr:SigE family RNA polymerase sigma factor [Streptomyces sp. ISL-43]MBT2453114.1 SigE family RNA polymerase sigma factor [Streptomyces sp. ISL-43]
MAKKWSLLLTELVQIRGSALNRYGFLLCGDRAEAADLVQEALVRVFAQPRSSWDVGDAEAYVRRTMLNYFVDQHRRRARFVMATPRLAQSTAVAEHSEGVGLRIDLLAALKGLSPRQRACVVLRYYEDCTVPVIASQLSCSEGTVKGHLSDALARLGAALDTPRTEVEGDTRS